MNVIEVKGNPRKCTLCQPIEKEKITVGQTIELFFDEVTLKRRKTHQSDGASIVGEVKSIRIGDDERIYSIKLVNDTLYEIIVSSISKFILVCDSCSKNN